MAFNLLVMACNLIIYSIKNANDPKRLMRSSDSKRYNNPAGVADLVDCFQLEGQKHF